MLWRSAWPLLTATILIHQMSKHVESALQSKCTLESTVESHVQDGHVSRAAQKDTHRTIMNSHPVSKWFRQSTCQAGHMENRGLSSQKSHGRISYLSGNIVKWDRFGLGSPHLALNSCPASHTGIKGCAYCSSSLNPRIPPVLSTLTQVMRLSEPLSPRLLKYQCHF